MKTILIIVSSIFLVGCASTQKAEKTQSPSLSGITNKIGEAQNNVKTVIKVVKDQAILDRLNAALRALDEANILAVEKQKTIDSITAALNVRTERLSYLEPKYNDAVLLLWKWRGLTIGGAVGGFAIGVITGAILMIIFRLWLKANVPILGNFL